MSSLKTSSTGPEVALRRELHRRGMRYRLNITSLPGRPDIVMTRARLAIFVDGCFWHGCPSHLVQPKANAAWWEAKLAANVARDRRVDAELGQLGWTVIRVWEHDDPVGAADEIERRWKAAGRRSR